MKNSILLLLVAFCLTIVSCGKDLDFKKGKKDDWPTFDFDLEGLEVCEWNEAEMSGPEFQEYVLKEVTNADECDCHTEGYLKYLKNGKTIALIYFGDGECDNWAVRIDCVDGDCEHELATMCKFEIESCQGI